MTQYLMTVHGPVEMEDEFGGYGSKEAMDEAMATTGRVQRAAPGGRLLGLRRRPRLRHDGQGRRRPGRVARRHRRPLPRVQGAHRRLLDHRGAGPRHRPPPRRRGVEGLPRQGRGPRLRRPRLSDVRPSDRHRKTPKAPEIRGLRRVREGGFEPPRPFGHCDLNAARLPFRHSRVKRAQATPRLRGLPNRPCRVGRPAGGRTMATPDRTAAAMRAATPARRGGSVARRRPAGTLVGTGRAVCDACPPRARPDDSPSARRGGPA